MNRMNRMNHFLEKLFNFFDVNENRVVCNLYANEELGL